MTFESVWKIRKIEKKFEESKGLSTNMAILYDKDNARELLINLWSNEDSGPFVYERKSFESDNRFGISLVDNKNKKSITFEATLINIVEQE